MIKIKKIVWDFSDTEFEDCDYEEARKVALARNPNATVVSVTAVF